MLAVGLLSTRSASEANGTLVSLLQDGVLPPDAEVLVVLAGDALGAGEVEVVHPATRVEVSTERAAAGAWARVVSSSDADWVLLVSDDVRLTKRSLAALVAAIDETQHQPISPVVVRDGAPGVTSSLDLAGGVCVLLPKTGAQGISGLRLVHDAFAYAIPATAPGGGAPPGDLVWLGPGDDDVAAEERMRRLHLGCGTNRIRGWLNVDGDPDGHPDVTLDLRFGIPMPDNCADRIYSEHLFEHLTRPDGEALLAECFRVLRPGGLIRTAMPDLGWVVREYLGVVGDWRAKEWREQLGADTACAVLNVALREWGHTYVYDADDFGLRLRNTGFEDLVACEVGESEHPDLRGLETRESSRLILEARKPVPGERVSA